MALKHPKVTTSAAPELALAPIFTLESRTLPRHELPADEMEPHVAYQIIHDELMLDGNARLNLATFVTTWMEPQAEKLMTECFDKEHDRQGRVPPDRRARDALCEHLSRLWHAPDADAATGCSTQVVAQYYNFLRLGFEGYRRVQAYAREVATRLSGMIAQLGSFELLTRGDELPVFVHCPQ